MGCNPSLFYGEWTWWSTVPCGVGPENTFAPSTVQEWSASSILRTTTAAIGGGVDAFSVQVRFQQSDVPELESAYSSFFGTRDSIFPTTTGSTQGATGSQTPAPQSNGLSKGAQTGIGVSVAIVVLATALIGACLFYRHKRGQKRARPTVGEDRNPDAVDNTIHGLYAKAELDATNQQRAAAHPGIGQNLSVYPAAELEAGNYATRAYQHSEPQVAQPAPVAELDAIPEIDTNTASHSGQPTQPLPQRWEHQEPSSASATHPEASLGPPTAILSIDGATDALGPSTTPKNAADEDEDEDEEVLRRRIQRIKAERERLDRINELAQLEDELERKLLTRRNPG
jgi:hypothetical protein